MITVPGIKKAIGIFSTMKFFQADEDFRAAVMELLGELCHNDEEVLWLARRVRNLHKEWPGAHELRATLCSKYKPRDGVDAYSAVYLDGIPSEHAEAPQIEARPTLAIAGDVDPVTIDPELARTIAEMSKRRTMPQAFSTDRKNASYKRTEEMLKQMGL